MSHSEPLHSPEWYRVAQVRLRLRSGISVSRQMVRGQPWHVLTDPVSGRHHRFNESAYRFIAACTGEATLDDIWQAELARMGDDATTQGEALRIVAQAHAANLVIGNVAPDAAALVKAQKRRKRQRHRAQANPLAFKVRLWNPDAFLAQHLPLARVLLSAPVRRGAWLLAAIGLMLLVLNGSEFAQDAREHLAQPRMLFAMWLIYPALKALHELAHAFLVKIHGGDVVEIGVVLLMLTPVPYVDASASTAFADKRKRVAVSSAGILVEALAASVALALWLILEPGLARELCLAVVTIGALSTLLVNGNPLMRFDGYHVLCDLLELPNLAPRSARWWTAVLQRHVLRLPRGPFEGLLRGEKPWLVAYAPLAWAWRLFLLATLSVAAAQFSAVLGLLLLAFALWAGFAGPTWKAARWAWRSPQAGGARTRVIATLAGAFAAALLLLAVPVPQRTLAPGVVWLPDEAILRLRSEARLEEFLVHDGQNVAAGTPIARLANEELVADLAKARAQWRTAEVERLRRFDSDAGRTAIAEEELRRLAAQVRQLQEQVDQLTLRAGTAGRVVIGEPQRHLGHWLPQGQTIAHVLPPGAPMVRALVRNDDITLVREDMGEVSVNLAHDHASAWPATLLRAVPLATAQLPTAALGDKAGGPIATDRTETSGRTATEPRFSFDLALPAGADARVGARAMVTFTHGSASVLNVVLRAWRQAFLRHFER